MSTQKVKLSVEGASKVFRLRSGGTGAGSFLPVLRRVSFEVYENEIVTLVGESGCGKTTLLRSIQGLVRLDSGVIRVNGETVTAPDRNRGFVFQQANLLPWRTARQNIEFGLELQGIGRKDRVARAQELLELVGLGGAGNQYPHELSGGMQQRIGLARALAINPAILLMDEPFSALDAQTRELLQQELLRIREKTRTTVLFVTHDLDEAIYISNRVIVLAPKPGRIERIIDVPFPRSRPDLGTLRGEPEFRRIRSEIWNLIRHPESEAA